MTQREIKFRAWGGNAAGMVYSHTDEGPRLVWFFKHYGKKPVMQYTGLKDNNGREIYEGDIVSACIDCGPAGVNRFVYPVSINSLGCGIQEWTLNDDPVYWPEVVGNIYENPELLDAGSEVSP